MPKYAGYNPKETCLYRGRRNRQSFDICYKEVGSAYSLDDKGAALYQIISEADPKMKHAFTPKVAIEFLRKRKSSY
jgi:hypothetical protein